MNHTRRDSATVLKSFVGAFAQRRFECELAALEYFKGKLPVPELVSKEADKLTLQTKFIPGIHAADVKGDDAMLDVQYACGQYLKTIHSSSVSGLSGRIIGTGSVVLHGDFSVRNILVSEADHKIVAILDWEKMRLGEPLRDLSWYEWILRLSCQVERRHLKSFYAGYGMDFPSWEVRRQGILVFLQSAVDDAVSRNDPPGVTYWMEQYAIGESLQELD